MDRPAAGQSDAIAEGRRLYLGNLSYNAQPEDLEQFLDSNGFGNQYDAINISVDPVTRRNPGYCFVDFVDREAAENALSSLVGSIDDRQIKVGPCRPKETRQRRWGDQGAEERAPSQRWGNRDGDRADARPDNRREQGPRGGADNFDDAENDGLRLYVGGLGPMIDQAQNDAELKELFAAFNPITIGKRIAPHESKRELPGNHHYCFIDFSTREDASAAIDALNGGEYDGGRLRVSLSKRIPSKQQERNSDASSGWRKPGGYPRQPAGGSPAGNRPRESTPRDANPRALAATSWRRADN